MPYGTHWEWRGFGTLDPEVEERIMRLPRAYPTPRSVTDQYIWTPGLTTNVKLRSWSGGASLKFKRLLQNDAEIGLQLWMEREDEDHQFPVTRGTIAELEDELNVELGVSGERCTYGSLLAGLGSARVKLIPVEKLRWLFRWPSDVGHVFVDLAELGRPVHTQTVGIEDALGTSGVDDDQLTGMARDLVLEARESLGLPDGLRRLSYLEAVASWEEKGLV